MKFKMGPIPTTILHTSSNGSSWRSFSYSSSRSTIDFFRLSGDALAEVDADDAPDDDTVDADALLNATRVASSEFSSATVLFSIWQSPFGVWPFCVGSLVWSHISCRH